MLVQIHAVELCFAGQAQRAGCVDQKHDGHSNAEGGQGYARAPDRLRFKQLESTAIEKSPQRCRIVGGKRAGGSILPAGKQTE